LRKERSMRKVTHAARMLLVATLLLAALGWVSDVLAGEKRGGTLTIVRPTDPVSLDSNLETTGPGAWVYYNITEPLLVLDEEGKLQPRLATSWQQLSPTKVRFKLRPNVKFHDGSALNAAAVKFTIERAFNGAAFRLKRTWLDRLYKIDIVSELPQP